MSKGKQVWLGFVVIIVIGVILSPCIRLWMYENHYERMGTYLILDREEVRDGGKSLSYDLISLDWAKKVNSVKVTALLYYKDLKQLSFGVISKKDSFQTKGLRILDQEKKSVGTLLTQGTQKFYTMTLEKLYIPLETSLQEGSTYTLQILDQNDAVIGEAILEY